MAPVQSSGPRRVATKRQGSYGEDLVQPGPQSSGDDEVAKMAEQLKKGVGAQSDSIWLVSKGGLTYRLTD